MLIYLLCFQEGKEKQAVPVVQLNVIRMLANMNVSVNKSEMVDMILPLFIESLEEGDASSPSVLRLQVRKCFLNTYCSLIYFFLVSG